MISKIRTCLVAILAAATVVTSVPVMQQTQSGYKYRNS